VQNLNDRPDDTSSQRWRPLTRTERRIVGVLVEKAKTTPDNYPLSLNALMNGCNQKSNRDPQMSLNEHEIEDALVVLRGDGAVTEVQGGSRVAKFRHHLKEWLGVDGIELAVMAELLLRGTQTVGELRGRAARMAEGKLPDLGSLRPILDALLAKGLIVELTAAGRGQIITHNLYFPEELERERRRAHSMEAHTSSAEEAPRSSRNSDLESLRDEMAQLREEVRRLAQEIHQLKG
jgi:uncharacterized protein YceH (UPF0502 family)